MENDTNRNENKTGLFSFLYRTRILITKDNVTIVNLSILFSLIALLVAPWLVVVGAIVALALGYRFSIDKNAEGFARDFEHMVKDAASSMKNAVENVTKKAESGDTEEHHDEHDNNNGAAE
jgi:hypothetical protein